MKRLLFLFLLLLITSMSYGQRLVGSKATIGSPTIFQTLEEADVSSLNFTKLTSLPTTLAGYGITNAWVTNANFTMGSSVSILSGSTSRDLTFGTTGSNRFGTITFNVLSGVVMSGGSFTAPNFLTGSAGFTLGDNGGETTPWIAVQSADNLIFNTINSGVYKFAGTSLVPATLQLFERETNGAHALSLKPAESMAANVEAQWPDATGTTGQQLRYASAGVLEHYTPTTDPGSVVGDIPTVTAVGTPNTYGNIAGVATGNALISGGVGVVSSYGKIGLTTHVSGDLPFSNFTQASAASKLLGRGSASGAGDYEEITIGSGLTMTGTTLSSTGGSLSDGDKGDITVSASGATWTIDADIAKTWTGNHVFSSAGADQLQQIRMANFSSTARMQAVFNNTSTEIHRLNSSGTAFWHFYNTSGTGLGRISYTTPAAVGPGVRFENTGLTNGYDITHNAANNVLDISNAYVLANTRVIIGGGTSVAATSSFQVRGYGNSNEQILLIENSSGTDRFEIQGDGDATLTGALQVTGSTLLTGLATGYVAKTALYTLTGADYTVEVTSGTHTQTLPTAVGIAGKTYVITNSGTGTVTVGTTSSQTFVNVSADPTTLTLLQDQTVIVQSNGANWLRISTL